MWRASRTKNNACGMYIIFPYSKAPNYHNALFISNCISLDYNLKENMI